MRYDFKLVAEFAWAVFLAAFVSALQVVVTTQFETLTDWRTWTISLGAAVARSGAGAAIALLTRRQRPE